MDVPTASSSTTPLDPWTTTILPLSFLSAMAVALPFDLRTDDSYPTFVAPELSDVDDARLVAAVDDKTATSIAFRKRRRSKR